MLRTSLVRWAALASARSCGSVLSVGFGENGERGIWTHLGELGGFSTAVPLALQAGAPLCERVDASPTIRAYPPPPDMTVQLTPSITSATGTSSSTIITRGSISAAAAATTTGNTASGGLTSSILRDGLAPDRNRALRPVLEHELLHEVVPPLRGAPARGKRLRQRQRRRGHERVCHA